jgi:hypothetical protein
MFASLVNKGQEVLDYWLGQPSTPQRTFGSSTYTTRDKLHLAPPHVVV